MKDDIVALILANAKRLMNQPDTRDDDTIDVLITVSETVTPTDSISVTLNPHPVKWDEFLWDLATWG